MRKEDIASAIIYLIMIAIALVVGFTAISDAFTNLYSTFNSTFNSFAFAIVVIIIGLLFNMIMLEVFHVLGGKMGKYDIVSVNVVGLCIYKESGKWKFGFKDFDGLTGETKLSPKSKDSNLKPFVWLPLFMYILELIGCITLYTLGTSMKETDRFSPLCWLAVAALLWVVISSMMALYNFVPVKLDSMTDGYRLMLLTKKVNAEAFNEVMRIENLQREGKPVDSIRVFDEITDYTASVNLYSVYEHLAKGEFEDAEKLIDAILEQKDKVSSITSNRLLAQKLYIKILTLSKEEAQKYYDSDVDDTVRRFISNDLSMESLRAYVLIAGMLDESIGEVQYANGRKSKALKRSLPARASIEDKLYEDALNLVKKSHPDWDLTKPAA